MMIPDRAPEKVTIEDLLRLKRAERPSPEFWARFEKDLRAKQLAAIVEKRPWWHALHLPQAARVISRFQAPVGAAAVLALSFVVVSQYRTAMSPASIIVTESAVSASASPVAVIEPMVSRVDAAADVVASMPAGEASVIKAESGIDLTTAPVQTEIAMSPTASPSKSAELTAMIPWGVGPTEEDILSTRLLNPSLQVTALSDMPVTSLLGNVRVDDGRGSEARPQVAEARPAAMPVSSPRELRRAKVLSGLVLADNAEGGDYAKVIHGRDIAANDLNDAQLYDSVRRLGMGGDRFTLKF